MQIETERLTFRLHRESDFDAMLDIYGRPEVARMVASWPIPPDHDMIRERTKPFPVERGLVGVIELAGKVIGSMGCARRPEEAFGLGYGLHPDHWGFGYATEMARAILGAIFQRDDCDLVTAGHFTDNPASGRVLTQLGFRYSHNEMLMCKGRGHEADCAEYVLTKSDWLEFQPQSTYAHAASAAKDKA